MARMYARTRQSWWKDTKMVLWKPWLEVEYAGIRVHYKRRLDGGGSSFGQDTLRFLKERGMPRQVRIFEWCAGPGFIGFSLLGHGLCDSLCLADINPFAVRAVARTVRANQLEDRVSVHLSDNLARVPSSERWNLVVSNPPHCSDRYHGSLRAHDPGWSIHAGFYAHVAEHLAPDGVILIQECAEGSSRETFEPMIERNGLRVVHCSEPVFFPARDAHFYFLASMRQGSTTPDWLSVSGEERAGHGAASVAR